MLAMLKTLSCEISIFFEGLDRMQTLKISFLVVVHVFEMILEPPMPPHKNSVTNSEFQSSLDVKK